MKQHYEVVIVGGGLAGLTLAALLAQSRHTASLGITLLDAAARPQFLADDDMSLRVSAIASGSARLLESIGAWPLISESRLSPYECMCVWDENDTPDGASALRFDAAEFAVPQLGFIVENIVLQDALLRQLDATNVELRFASPMRSLEQSGRQFKVELEGGECCVADLVVGADGARSFVRRAAAIETGNGHTADGVRYASSSGARTQGDSLATFSARRSARHLAAGGRPGFRGLVHNAGPGTTRAWCVR